MPQVLGDCQFAAELNDNGLWVGVCREFPDLRSRPRKSKLDAIDDIVAKVAEKLRQIDGRRAGHKAAKR